MISLRGIRWLYRSSLFIVLRTRVVLALKLFQVTPVYHLNLVAERLLKVELGWAPIEEDPLHLFIVVS
jgi:hypothetical protein